ncbi:hypothetical protein ABVN23_20370 [Pseudomonas fluorescens]|uniref:hypothetical protein n=1 Tax=Pseudomonas fluorescens TaxID=294 RepID=UPI003F97F512
MSNDTRQRLINIIINHHFSPDGKKLQVGKIADEAGVTRQAFHRYYGDLLGYVKGDKAAGELLPDSNQESVSDLLIKSKNHVIALENELSAIKESHNTELKKVLDKHITSLMNNDITLLETDDIRITLEKQTTLIQNYSEQIASLKAQITKSKIISTNESMSSTTGSRVVLDPKLESAMASYIKDSNYDAYLDSKDKEIAKLLTKINSFTDKKINLIIFIDKHLCGLSNFLEMLPPSRSPEIVLRAPIFTAIELRNLISKITAPLRISVFIPDFTSTAEANAQRTFRSANLPIEEIKLSEKADHIYLTKGIDSVVYLSAKNGK